MTRIKKDKNKNTKKGFSMLEVVISVFVVAVGLVAAINLMVNGINHSTDSRDHIIASQLAQEGVELVRNLRDNNWADPAIADSFDNNNFPIGDDNRCRIDKDSDVRDCDNGVIHKKLNYSGNDFYVHAAGTATKFQRKIELIYNPTGVAATADNLTVTSIVIWGRADNDFPAVCNVGNKCVYTQSILTKWGE